MNAEHKHKNSIIPHSLNNLRHPPTSKDDGFAMNKNVAQFYVGINNVRCIKCFVT